MEGKGKRQASNGGGQSTLGYLFGANCTEQQDEEPAPVQVTKPPLMEQDVNAAMAMNVAASVKKMLLKDLRTELRAHGLEHLVVLVHLALEHGDVGAHASAERASEEERADA